MFGEVAELYDKARPSYPAALIDQLATLAGPDARVLDVGCGTGKATVLLAGRGLGGVGLEPDPEMAAVARRNLAPFPRWSVAAGDFEDYDPPQEVAAGGFDLITCAQAWHWLDPARRFQHAAHLLRPGGWLALFWNRTADDFSLMRRQIDGVYAALVPALSPHGPLTVGQPPVGSPPPEARFGSATWQVFPWVRRYTTAQWIELTQTHSDHRILDPERRMALLEQLAAVLDANGGAYDNPYNCWLWTASRL